MLDLLKKFEIKHTEKIAGGGGGIPYEPPPSE